MEAKYTAEIKRLGEQIEVLPFLTVVLEERLPPQGGGFVAEFYIDRAKLRRWLRGSGANRGDRRENRIDFGESDWQN